MPFWPNACEIIFDRQVCPFKGVIIWQVSGRLLYTHKTSQFISNVPQIRHNLTTQLDPKKSPSPKTVIFGHIVPHQDVLIRSPHSLRIYSIYHPSIPPIYSYIVQNWSSNWGLPFPRFVVDDIVGLLPSLGRQDFYPRHLHTINHFSSTWGFLLVIVIYHKLTTRLKKAAPTFDHSFNAHQLTLSHPK